MRMLKYLSLFFALMLPTFATAQANVVVELFTSQGCSSCPPADKVLQELAEDNDVIVLGWHVDYWDYLGWKDESSAPQNTARQNGYRVRWNLRSLYTPQAVIHGETQVIGSNEAEIRMYIDQFQAEKPMVEIGINFDGDRALVEVSPRVSGLPTADIFLVRILSDATSEIKRGENAGKTIRYVNIVEELTLVSQWNGKAAIKMAIPVDVSSEYVLLIQAKEFGPVLGVEYLR